jgi:hypothetical protein
LSELLGYPIRIENTNFIQKTPVSAISEKEIYKQLFSKAC